MPNFGSSLLAAALVAGAAIPFQAGANAMLGRLLGHPLWATMVSLAVSVALAVPVMLALKVPVPAFATAAATGPWWVWIGGGAGVVYVTAALLLAPKMGAASFIVAVIGGQMMASLIIDHFGLMGFVQRPANAVRIAGLVLIVAGLIVTQWASAAKAG
jgi:transporter family-2 protein